MLGQFQAHGLLPLDPVGLLEGRKVEPAHRLFPLGNDLAAIVDQTVDPPHPGSLEGNLSHVDLGCVVRAEDERLDARTAAISGERRPGVAVGRHRQPVEPQFLGHRYRQSQAASFERAGRQAALVLDENLGAAGLGFDLVEWDERSHRFAQRDDAGGISYGEELPVPPHVGWAGGQRVLVHAVGQSGKVVADQERFPGVRQPVYPVRCVALAGSGAFEVRNEGRPMVGEVGGVGGHTGRV